MKNLKPLFVLLLTICFIGRSFANEGMWLPQLLEQLNENEMKAKGCKLSAKDIYNINKASLKDAIVSFGGFCTAEVISDQGLLLTNHHCGYSAIQKHSSLQNNYLDAGFWAMSKKEELPNEGLTATFIVRIDDVTSMATKNVRKDMPESERQLLIQSNINELTTTVKKEAWQESFVRAFFDGNKYYLFVTETFKDVRLVGAPPSSIGKFGSDTDNWMWPRHTGDFSIFRIYADQNNRPAAYSPNNVPYKPKHALSISLDGVAKNDFTMVFGFPGRTQEYLPSVAIAQTLNVLNPAKIDIRTKTLKIWDSYMRSNEQTKIQYAAKYASMANAWKKWMGENLGLSKSNAIAKKKSYEASFVQRISGKSILNEKYGNVLSELEKTYASIEQYALARDIYNETTRAIELFSICNQVIGFVNAYNTPKQSEVTASLASVAKAFYKNYDAKVDKEVCREVMRYYLKKMPAHALLQGIHQHELQDQQLDNNIELVYANSIFANESKFNEWIKLPVSEAVSKAKADPAFVSLFFLQEAYTKNNAEPLKTLQNQLDLQQRTYMQAQMEVFTNKKFYPDANSTLRITYGNVGGYNPKDAIAYNYYTYLDGVMEKYIPGDYEFDVPAKLIDLYQKKDYGIYGVNGKMPVCFIASNHTTGGNSGSPVLDASGNLIGLNFDRVWEGTMSDINYDASICRNIMVDARYILFIIDKYAGASHLVQEMKLVHPKAKMIKQKKAA
ncbi:S46 family peptidase [Chitinophagaceae bacterium LB-8]|uniref:Dipeptidyl-peptidase n=1 Tax=Paraflavisolibacter caeni TaxID=2982496 RepID=A0A9X2XQ12_9BACT|nr:S46 family peptidase [Paraflavisolibacter caeni]MCU7552703.1 S46 family peptidase [Paraflavisolibacter caeni]